MTATLTPDGLGAGAPSLAARVPRAFAITLGGVAAMRGIRRLASLLPARLLPGAFGTMAPVERAHAAGLAAGLRGGLVGGLAPWVRAGAPGAIP